MRSRPIVSRRAFLGTSAAGVVSLVAPDVASAQPAQSSQSAQSAPVFVYVGTYTRPPSGKAEGIYVFRMDPATGALRLVQTVPSENPSFLALDPARQFLYAVNETNPGEVSAFAVDAASGMLTPLNRQSASGAAPCHLSVDASGRWVVIANYTSGNFAVLPIEGGGRLGPVASTVQNSGIGPNAQRQEGPHAHMIGFDPGGQYVLGVDLGIDRTRVFRLDAAAGRLNPVAASGGESPLSAAPGAGPRHFAFHPNGQFVFVINELSSTLSAFAFDSATGGATEMQTLSTLPPDFVGQSSTAEVIVHPNGRFVYGSNRGHDSIAIFAVDEATGRMTARGHESTRGRTPRCFGIDPTGSFLYAANQNTDNILAFRIAPDTGRLTPTGQVTTVPTPVCVIFG